MNNFRRVRCGKRPEFISVMTLGRYLTLTRINCWVSRRWDKYEWLVSWWVRNVTCLTLVRWLRRLNHCCLWWLLLRLVLGLITLGRLLLMMLWSRNLWSVLNSVLNYMTVRGIQVYARIHRLWPVSIWNALLLMQLMLMLLLMLLMLLMILLSVG